MKIEKKRLGILVGGVFIASLVLVSGLYTIWYRYGYGAVPKNQVQNEVSRHLQILGETPEMLHKYSTCGGVGDKNFNRITYTHIDGNLYLVQKMRSSRIYEEYVNFTVSETNVLIIGLNCSYVDCYVLSKMYLYVPDVPDFEQIEFIYYDYILADME